MTLQTANAIGVLLTGTLVHVIILENDPQLRMPHLAGQSHSHGHRHPPRHYQHLRREGDPEFAIPHVRFSRHGEHLLHPTNLGQGAQSCHDRVLDLRVSDAFADNTSLSGCLHGRPSRHDKQVRDQPLPDLPGRKHALLRRH